MLFLCFGLASAISGPGLTYRWLTALETSDEGRLVARRIVAAVNRCDVEELTYLSMWQPGAMIYVEPCNIATLQERAETIAGWDRLVVLGAYSSGSQVADDPLLGGHLLRRQIRAEDGPLYDELCRFLVIEDSRIVANLTIASFLDQGSALIVRSGD